ncbi:glycosyltransferase [Synechococcus sp. CCY 0621]|uniref:glycosyltransferase n=1 Tax=Synechococcus sp. CCY 0621 TaxID=2815603 RepID=UPI001C24D4A3|nr:glycosyltransferase [Synechococcus sp. CCY 0621]
MLSVVIGSYNRLSLLHACIQSIRESSISTRIYISDAGSEDGTVEYLQSLNPQEVTCIFHPQKIGQAKAYNEIFSKITTPYTCWLSDDNIVVNDGLATAVNILEQDTKIGMVGLKVRDMQGPFASEPYIGGISTCGILNVNQGLLRTKLLQELGGFSEAFMDYGIDPDLTARMLFSGRDIVYTRNIALQHWRDWGTDTQLERQLQKQEDYQSLYSKTFAKNQTKPKSRRLKRLYRNVGRLLKHAPGMRNNQGLKGLLRDINNILTCHYISPYDPILCTGKAYHLRQSLQRQTILGSSVSMPTKKLESDPEDVQAQNLAIKTIPTAGVRVAINAQLLEGSAGGIETNLLQLIRGLALQNEPGDSQFLIGPGGESAWLESHISSSQSIVAWRPIRYASGSIFGWPHQLLRYLRDVKQSLRMASAKDHTGVTGLDKIFRLNGIELIHFPYQRFYPTSLPFIFEPWDLQHIHLPELFAKEEILFRNRHYSEACKKAAVVVTATRSTKYDIARYFQIPASKIAVIYRGVEPPCETPVAWNQKVSQAEKMPIEAGSYAIYPAKPWPHKNHERLFAALAKIKKDSGLRIPVVCTGRAVKGREGHLEALAQHYDISDQIYCIGYLSESEIQLYLSSARLLLFPSLFEGLGIPLLEAMDRGVPITCSNVSCIPEVVGKAALMFDPYSVDDIAAKLTSIWLDENLRRELAQWGKQRAKDFSWEQATSSFRLLYRYVAKRSLSDSEKVQLQRMFA